MRQNIFGNIQPVIKNLLIINVLFFLATAVFQNQNIDLVRMLGLYYFDSESFRPYQIATHFFMHASLGHIFFNMFGLVVFGNVLEKVWGPKRFLIFYFVTAIGAAFLYQLVAGIELYSITGTFRPYSSGSVQFVGEYIQGNYSIDDLRKILGNISVPTVGASGAIYGLLAAVALLFPNTTVYLYFAIPIKMKWLALILGAGALIYGLRDNPADNVAHFAHLGGMLFGFIMVKIWGSNRNQFY